MEFEEMFKSWTLEQKVEWALWPNICNLSKNMRSIIVDLKAENERLTGENAKLKCLAMHGMFGYACAKMNVLVEKYEKEFASGMVHKDFSRWHRLSRLWCKAYRKAKAELKGTK